MGAAVGPYVGSGSCCWTLHVQWELLLDLAWAVGAAVERTWAVGAAVGPYVGSGSCCWTLRGQRELLLGLAWALGSGSSSSAYVGSGSYC